jgi:hypothetical protein
MRILRVIVGVLLLVALLPVAVTAQNGGPGAATDARDDRFYWDVVKDTKDPAVLQAFVERFPLSLYRPYAEALRQELLDALPPPDPVETAEPPAPAPIKPPPLLPPPVPQLAVYDDVDFYLGDLAMFRANNLAQCATACTETAQCDAFTYNSNTASTKGPNCFAKRFDGVSRLEPYKGAFSGRIVPAGGDDTAAIYRTIPIGDLLYGADITGRDLYATAWPGARTLDACRLACIDNAQCAAFSFAGKQRQCWMKASVGPTRPNSNVTTGIKTEVRFSPSVVVPLE